MTGQVDKKRFIFDPLRKKEVAQTPEEQVRQWFIAILRDNVGVPVHMMMSEVGFKLSGKQFRADIIVYDRKASPLAVVECKRPEVSLDKEVLEQAIRYNLVLNVKYIFITNGLKTFICRSEFVDGQKRFVLIKNLPTWTEMLELD